MKLKELQRVDMPRERLGKYGPDKLKDEELLAILLGSGIRGTNVLTLARRVLLTMHKVGKRHIRLEDLTKIKGLGKVKAGQIISMLALAERLAQNEKTSLLSAQDVWNHCADFRASMKEHFVAGIPK